MFHEGLKQFAVSKGVNDANEKLSQLNSMEMDRSQRIQAQSQIGNELALRLGAAGADAATINQLAGQLAPSAGAQFQAEENKSLQEVGNQFKADEAQKDREHQERLQKLKLDAMGFKSEKDTKKMLAGFADKFRKENKATLEARDKLDGLKSILDKTPDRVGIEMAKTGLLKFAGEDRVSDADVARAQRDPSLRAGIARRLKLEATGEALKDDRKFYQMILDHAGKKMNETLTKKVKDYAGGTAELADIDGNKLQSGLMKQLGLEGGRGNTEIEMARAWLQSDAAKKNPAKAKLVAEKLKKMEQGM